MVTFGRPRWTSLSTLLYLGQTKLRESGDNDLATLAETCAPRRPVSPLAAALITAQPTRTEQRTREQA
jgi:hypothetical protein